MRWGDVDAVPYSRRSDHHWGRCSPESTSFSNRCSYGVSSGPAQLTRPSVQGIHFPTRARVYATDTCIKKSSLHFPLSVTCMMSFQAGFAVVVLPNLDSGIVLNSAIKIISTQLLTRMANQYPDFFFFSLFSQHAAFGDILAAATILQFERADTWLPRRRGRKKYWVFSFHFHFIPSATVILLNLYQGPCINRGQTTFHIPRPPETVFSDWATGHRSPPGGLVIMFEDIKVSGLDDVVSTTSSHACDTFQS